MISVLFLLFFLSTGCLTGSVTPRTPLTTARTYISPAVPADLQDNFLDCFTTLEGISPEIFTAQEPYPDLNSADIYLWWGNPDEFHQLHQADLPVHQVGNLTVDLLVHPANSGLTFSPEETRRIFTGQLTRWNELSSVPPPSAIQVWVLPEKHPVQYIFQRAVMQDASIINTARVGPDLASLQQASTENPGFVGLTIKAESQGTQEPVIQPAVSGLRQPLLLITADPGVTYGQTLAACLVD